jgi:aminoglycoside phosphotransferase
MGASSPLKAFLGEDAPPPSEHLLSLLAGTSLHEAHEGLSGSRVFHVERNGIPVSYLKIAQQNSADDLQPELARLLVAERLSGRRSAGDVETKQGWVTFLIK